jgi:hypothetical protein
MKLPGWRKTTFAGVRSIAVLSGCTAAQDTLQEPKKELHLVTASTPRERQIELALSTAPTELRGRLLLGALLLFPSIVLGQAQAPAKPEPATIRPLKVDVPDQVLVDLRTIYVGWNRDGW